MAYFSFTKAILDGQPIKVFNQGDMYRDFTYIDDIVAGMVNVIPNPPARMKTQPAQKYINIGNNQPKN